MKIAVGTIGIAAILAAAIWAAGAFFPSEEPPILPARIHYFRNPPVSLNNIELKVFYAVPADRSGDLWAGRQEALEAALKKISHFHSVQFLGKSRLTYEIVPEPVVLESASGTAGLLERDPETLAKLAAAAPPASPLSPDHFAISVFIFEGPGTGGEKGRAYAPAEIFRDGSFDAVKESVLYRAIAQAMGLPAGGEGATGAGAFRPIEMNFIEPQLTRQMGLLD